MELREITGKKVNDGFERLCRNQSSVKEENHHVFRSVRKGFWFELSNMDICVYRFVSDAKRSPPGGATVYQLLHHSINRQVAFMVAKNDASVVLSARFRCDSIDSPL
ncbi:hypothetical protein TNCV_2424351 [Trichonephila clavipes]|nr:hypothetical protein TNCV_2424351 [Trichonephila clavipes]